MFPPCYFVLQHAVLRHLRRFPSATSLVRIPNANGAHQYGNWHILNMSPYCSVIHLVCHTDERLWRVSHTLFGSNLLCLRKRHQLCSWRLRFYSLQTGILWVQTFSLNKLCADGPAKYRCKPLISFGARFSPTSLETYVERGGTAVRVVYVAWPAAGPQQCLSCTVIVSFFHAKHDGPWNSLMPPPVVIWFLPMWTPSFARIPFAGWHWWFHGDMLILMRCRKMRGSLYFLHSSARANPASQSCA